MAETAEGQGERGRSATWTMPRLVDESPKAKGFGYRGASPTKPQSLALGCALSIALLLSAVSVARATFIQNTFGLSDPHSTITFGEHVFSDGYPITTEYADLGITLSPFAYSFPSLCECVTSFIPNTQEVSGLRLIQFSQPQTEAAFALATYDGTLATFQALLGGSVVESATALVGSSFPNFYGFRDITFDAISLSTNNWPGWCRSSGGKA